LKAKKRPAKRKRNPLDEKEFARAKRLSKQFHGRTEVVELSAKERKPLPKYVVVAGELDEFTYAPNPKSKKGDAVWSHKTRDRGFLRSKGKRRPLLVVDPKTKRAAIVPNRSGMKFDPKAGFVG